MKKVLLLGALALSLFSKGLDVTVSIVPQKTIVEKIGGDLVDVNLMVLPGADPHTYEPKPKQMVALNKSALYFAVGIEFEDAWLKKFEDLNPKLKIIHNDEGIKKIEMVAHHHGHEEHGHDDHDDHKDEHGHEKHHDHDDHKDEHGHEKHHDHDDHKDEHGHEKHHDHDDHKDEHGHEKHHDHDDHKDEHGHEKHADHDEHEEHEGLDPHIWTSPKNLIIMSENVYKALSKADPKNSATYKANLKKFKGEIEIADFLIKDALHKHEGKKFAVFHPSWGYFAKDYHLEQVAMEVEGKSPKAKEIIEIVKELKEENIKTLFTQPEFSKKSAQTIAKEINGVVTSYSPLHPKILSNLVNFAKAIDKGFAK